MVQLRLSLKLKLVCVAKFCSVMLSLKWGCLQETPVQQLSWQRTGDIGVVCGWEEWALVVYEKGISSHPEFPWVLFKPTHKETRGGYLCGCRCAQWACFRQLLHLSRTSHLHAGCRTPWGTLALAAAAVAAQCYLLACLLFKILHFFKCGAEEGLLSQRCLCAS